jgi:hypothetical protein
MPMAGERSADKEISTAEAGGAEHHRRHGCLDFSGKEGFGFAGAQKEEVGGGEQERGNNRREPTGFGIDAIIAGRAHFRYTPNHTFKSSRAKTE